MFKEQLQSSLFVQHIWMHTHVLFCIITFIKSQTNLDTVYCGTGFTDKTWSMPDVYIVLLVNHSEKHKQIP